MDFSYTGTAFPSNTHAYQWPSMIDKQYGTGNLKSHVMAACKMQKGAQLLSFNVNMMKPSLMSERMRGLGLLCAQQLFN